jgi:aminoglycoside phosphotransferase (APT) family kinase protein
MDWPKVADYLASRVDAARGPMQVRQFPGGSANLTYLISFGEQEYVLRRPPLGPVAPGAHDMAREHKVLSRLYAAFDRAPRSFHLCTDESVIGAKFIVVERRTGVVIRDHFPEAMLPHPRLAGRTSYALVDAMADLHNVDPQANGLGDLGRPDGFARRQVEGWGRPLGTGERQRRAVVLRSAPPPRGSGAVAATGQHSAQRSEIR